MGADVKSQGIRLPAKLRLQGQEVRIEQIGKALWVQPAATASANMGQWLEDFYATTEALPPDFLAAHAMAEDSVIITNNAREFHRVPGLAVEEWAL